MRAFVLADDLTGAADTGLPFVSVGLTARVLLGEDDPAEADVLVVSTETRNLPREAALARVGEWAGRLARFSGGQLLVKKIDSTLRGWIGAEIRVLLDALPPAHTAWIVPAYPAQGRRMRGGVYTVHDVPLHQTEFARDVPGCGDDSAVLPLLEAQLGERIGFVSSDVLAEGSEAIGEAAERDGRRAVLFDAWTDEELDRIVAAGQQTMSPVLWTGSAGLATALARRLAAGRLAKGEGSRVVLPPSAGPVVLIAGSRNPATLRQLAFVRERVPLRHLTLDADGEIAPAPVILLTVGEEPGTGDADELAVASRLGAAAARLIARNGSDRLILTGGDTAAATLRHLEAKSLEILGAVEEGIPLLRIAGGKANGALAVTKAGGFGSPSSLYNAFTRLVGLEESV